MTEIKFAILSHILPPSPSGQSMILSQLLRNMSPERYVLLSQTRYEPHEQAARYYHLQNEAIKVPNWLRLPAINPNKQTSFHKVFRPFLRLYARMHNTLYGRSLSDASQTIANLADQIEEVIRRESCCVLVACTGDLYDLPAAHLACKRLDIPLIPYIFDYYAYQWEGEWRAFAKELEPTLLKDAAAIIVTNEHMAAEYKRLYGVESTIIRNMCALPNMDALDQMRKVFADDAINIVYTGAVYRAHYDAFRNLLNAIRQVGRSDIKVHLYTSQPPALLALEGISGPAVVFHDHIAHTDVPAIQRQADILFLPLAFDSPIPKVIQTSSPGKVGEYLAVGRPILVHAPEDSFISWYFRENRCGIVVDQNDVEMLAGALTGLIADKGVQATLGWQAIAQAAKDFDLSVVHPQFTQLLETICGENSA